MSDMKNNGFGTIKIQIQNMSNLTPKQIQNIMTSSIDKPLTFQEELIGIIKEATIINKNIIEFRCIFDTNYFNGCLSFLKNGEVQDINIFIPTRKEDL